jgi:hypothetical protein
VRQRFRRAAGVLLLVAFAALLVPAVAFGQDEVVAGDVGSTIDTQLQMWNVIAGFIGPIVLSVIIQTGWSRSVQAVLAFAYSAGLSVVTTALESKLDFDNWVTSLFVVFTATISAYHGFWKPTQVAPKIEKATSPGA